MKIELAESGTKSLLDLKRELEQKTVAQIEALLQERVDLVESRDKRLQEIASELKALGWHRTRAAKDVQTNGEK
jgi:hypothetical protein